MFHKHMGVPRKWRYKAKLETMKTEKEWLGKVRERSEDSFIHSINIYPVPTVPQANT